MFFGSAIAGAIAGLESAKRGYTPMPVPTPEPEVPTIGVSWLIWAAALFGG